MNDFVGKLWPRWLNIFCSIEVSDVLPIVKLCLVNRDDPTSFFDGTFVRCKVVGSDFETLVQTNHLARSSKTTLRTSPNSFQIYQTRLHYDVRVPLSWIFDQMLQLGGSLPTKLPEWMKLAILVPESEMKIDQRRLTNGLGRF